MTAQVYYSPFVPVFNGNGLPVPGAKIYFFYTNTNNLAPIYSDEALTTSLGNPVAADLAGKFPNIYIDSGVIYRVRVTDSLGIPLGNDIDPYIPLAGSQTAQSISYGIRNVKSKLDEIVSVADYAINGVVTPESFRNALTKLSVSNGGTLNIPRGAYQMASDDLANNGALTLADNVTIEGNGSIVTITGTSVIPSVFKSLNTSNISINDLLVVGNSKAVLDASSGAFFNYTQDVNGTGTENIRLSRIRLSNFGAERWISILNNGNPSATIRGIDVDVSAFSVSPDNNPAPTIIGGSSSVIFIFGNTSTITDGRIRLFADASFIKTGITLFHKVQGFVIDKPQIINAGQGGTSNDVGAYAINIYGDSGELNDITINDAVITNPRSCGIYLRGVQSVAVNNPKISGQTDTVTVNLPKAAIATNGATHVVINGGVLKNNVYDVYVVATTNSDVLDVKINDVTTEGASLASFVLNPASGTLSPDGVQLNNCSVKAQGRGLQVLNNINGNGGRNIKNVVINGGSWKSLTAAALEFNPFGGGVFSGYKVSNCTVSGGSRGIDADGGTGDFTISNVIVEDSGAGTQIYGVIARNVPYLFIDNVLIRNMATGFATLTDGANGTVKNLRQFNCINGFSPSSLGMILPTINGTRGWSIENLNPSAGGFTSWTYTATGWKQSGSIAA